jgi:AraC-like DNA-binding protein
MHNDRDWFTQVRRRAQDLVRDARATHPFGVRDLARSFVKAIPAPQKEIQEALLGLTLCETLLALELIARPDPIPSSCGDWLVKLTRAEPRERPAIFIAAAEGIVLSAMRAGGEPDLADRAERLVTGDVASCRTVGDLASRLNCHPRRLQQVFRGKYRMSVHRYLDTVRSAEAVRLIRQEGLKVEAAALAVGLRSRTTLYRLIRRTTGQDLPRIRRAATNN